MSSTAFPPGYAGCLAALHKAKLGTPMLTTEHGLYTRERSQEIWDADWIPGEAEANAHRSGNFFKGWWNRMFRSLERITYGYSDAVVSLFEANRKYQIGQGSTPERTLVIPNGIELALYENVRRNRRSSGKYHLGLVGRVVPSRTSKPSSTRARSSPTAWARRSCRYPSLDPSRRTPSTRRSAGS
jgi:glycosyltransferase involved in cell wall biosynthesis